MSSGPMRFAAVLLATAAPVLGWFGVGGGNQNINQCTDLANRLPSIWECYHDYSGWGIYSYDRRKTYSAAGLPSGLVAAFDAAHTYDKATKKWYNGVQTDPSYDATFAGTPYFVNDAVGSYGPSVQYIKGNTDLNIEFPSKNIPAGDQSICTMARWTSSSSTNWQRIFNGINKNHVQGHHSGRIPGSVYQGASAGWVTYNTGSPYMARDSNLDWVVTCSTNANTKLVIANGDDLTLSNSNRDTQSFAMNINQWEGQKSPFGAGGMWVWNRLLNEAELRKAANVIQARFAANQGAGAVTGKAQTPTTTKVEGNAGYHQQGSQNLATCASGYTLLGCSCMSHWRHCKGAVPNEDLRSCKALGFDSGSRVNAIAVCGKVLGTGIRGFTARSTFTGSTAGQVETVTCPSGTVLTGCSGAGYVSTPRVTHQSSTTCKIETGVSSSQSVVYAICYSGLAVSAPPVAETQTKYTPYDDNTSVLNCPPGTKVTSCQCGTATISQQATCDGAIMDVPNNRCTIKQGSNTGGSLQASSLCVPFSTVAPTSAPTGFPTTKSPTAFPTTKSPTDFPTVAPTTLSPTDSPTAAPTYATLGGVSAAFTADELVAGNGNHLGIQGDNVYWCTQSADMWLCNKNTVADRSSFTLIAINDPELADVPLVLDGQTGTTSDGTWSIGPVGSGFGLLFTGEADANGSVTSLSWPSDCSCSAEASP